MTPNGGSEVCLFIAGNNRSDCRRRCHSRRKKNFFCQPLSNDTTSSSSTVSLFLSLSHSQLSLLSLPLSLFLSIMQYLSFSLLFANSSVSPLINRTVSPSLCLYSFLNWSIPGFFLLFSSFKCSF